MVLVAASGSHCVRALAHRWAAVQSYAPAPRSRAIARLHLPVSWAPVTRATTRRAHIAMAPELDMWRIERARLQENYRRELLRRPRRFLPFPQAREWARAMWFTTREDWMEMLNRGEKRNPYLPRRPDKYYEGKGWVSWDDFLNTPTDPED